MCCARRMSALPPGAIAISAVSDADFTAPRIFVSTDGGRGRRGRGGQERRGAGERAAGQPAGLAGHAARRVTLNTDRGPHDFPVAGIYRDYSSSQGTVMMALDLYRSSGTTRRSPPIALKLAPGADVDAMAQALADRLAGLPGGGARSVRPNAALRGRGAGRLRPGVCHHRRAAVAGRDRRVHRRAERAALAPAGAGARAGHAARRRSDRPPVARRWCCWRPG